MYITENDKIVEAYRLINEGLNPNYAIHPGEFELTHSLATEIWEEWGKKMYKAAKKYIPFDIEYPLVKNETKRAFYMGLCLGRAFWDEGFSAKLREEYEMRNHQSLLLNEKEKKYVNSEKNRISNMIGKKSLNDIINYLIQSLEKNDFDNDNDVKTLYLLLRDLKSQKGRLSSYLEEMLNDCEDILDYKKS